ncbi:MAG: carboxypeptidase-like regulatory domain-containing protein, partial [Tannerella sp.]|nr:carboxypeptidase-like regulatory domain-containing protein [Tannerella sp.]
MMNIKNLWLKQSVIVCLLPGFCLPVMAQSLRVSGKVTDTGGEPLTGVSIRVSSAPQTGTATDINGAYDITVPDGDAELRFSYIGYVSKSVKTGERKVIDVILEEDSRMLE